MRRFKSVFRSTIIGFILLMLAIFPFSTAMAGSLGPNNPEVGSNVTGIGTEAWVDPGEVTTPGSPYARVTLLQGHQESNYLQGSDYGFALPLEATITGIEVSINRMSDSHNPNVVDNVVSLVKAGAIVGDNKAIPIIPWPITLTAATYGGPTDLWGVTWTPADVNSPNFGVVLAVYRDNHGNKARDAVVDSMQITVYFTIASTTTGVDCGNGIPEVTYGDSIACKATVNGSGFLTPTGTVGWTSGGSGSFDFTSCNLVEVSNGVAACEVVYTPSEVGGHLITANYSGDVNYDPGNGSESVTVDKKTASVTPDAGSKTYGGTDPSLTGTLEGFLAGDNVTAVYSRVAGETVLGGPYTITAVLSPNEVLGNYEITYNTADFTINPKAASVTPNVASKIYGNTDPVLTGTLEGFLVTDSVTATYSRTTGENVSGSPYLISAALSPANVLSNYNIIYNTANFTITQRPITVTADAKTKIVGQPDPPLTYQITSGSLVSGDAFTGALSRVSGENVGPHAIIQGTLALNANYILTYYGANLTITRQTIYLTIIIR